MLTDRLARKIASLSAGDILWRQTVYDHYTWLVARCTIREITQYEQEMYRSRMHAFCTQELNIPHHHVWIIQWLNGMHTNIDFNGIKTLTVPSPRTIVELEDIHQSSKSTKISIN